MIFWIKAVI